MLVEASILRPIILLHDTDLFLGKYDEFGLKGQILDFVIPGMKTVGHIEVKVAVYAKYHIISVNST